METKKIQINQEKTADLVPPSATLPASPKSVIATKKSDDDKASVVDEANAYAEGSVFRSQAGTGDAVDDPGGGIDDPGGGGNTGDLGSFGNRATPTTTSSETSVSSISSSLTTGSSLLSPSDESAPVVVADPMSNDFDTNDCATGSFCSSCSIPPRVAGGLWRGGVGCDACCFPMGIARPAQIQIPK